MTIRKTAAGKVTEVERDGQPLTAEAARDHPWTQADDQDLADENTAADAGDD
jgi:hypothetical protein